MIDLDRMGKAKADLLGAERQIRALLDDGEKAYLTDPRGPPALKYLLVVAVEAVTDICQHVLAKAKQVPCDGYVDCIAKAGTEGIIGPRLAMRLRRLADLRNSLVHRYWIIEDDRLFGETRENLGDLAEFLAEVDVFVGALAKRRRPPYRSPHRSKQHRFDPTLPAPTCQTFRPGWQREGQRGAKRAGGASPRILGQSWTLGSCP